ncbi:MAG: acyl-CoA dehydrogenase C-terminal domain-containing protein, partial [Rhodocyclaceae bacterium]|nr:acyl-CoA dehydrogenase C-terminal domain-containing protein [Rhodocyclaceae bacterium]
TAIQANDLIGRKIAREGGATIKAVIADMRETAGALAAGDDTLKVIGKALGEGVDAVEAAVAYIVDNFAKDVKAVHVGSVPFLKLMGIVSGGWQMARAAQIATAKLAAGEGDAAFYRAKLATARFFADHVMAQAPGLSRVVVGGASGALALDEDLF